MPTVTARMTDLFLLQDLEDVGKTTGVAERERAALDAIAAWIRTFVSVAPPSQRARMTAVVAFPSPGPGFEYVR